MHDYLLSIAKPNPTAPNHAQNAAADIHRDASQQAAAQLKEINRNVTSVQLKPVEMRGQEQLNANLAGKIGANTELPPEMLDYANADIEAQVRQGVDKDLQPAVSKNLKKIQKDVQAKEAERDQSNQAALTKGQQSVEREERVARKEQDQALAAPQKEITAEQRKASASINSEMDALKRENAKTAKKWVSTAKPMICLYQRRKANY